MNYFVKTALVGVALAIGCAADWMANLHGYWICTFTVGALIGLVPIRASSAVLLSLGTTLLGWGLPLIVLGMSFNLRLAASAISAVMGFGTADWFLVDTLTMVIGMLLGLTGTWLGKGIAAFFYTPVTPRSSRSYYRAGI